MGILSDSRHALRRNASYHESEALVAVPLLPFPVPDGPKTLGEINPDAEISPWPGARGASDLLAAKAMRVIARWSEIDVAISGVAAAFLGVNLPDITAMLSVLRGAKTDAVLALARLHLSDDDLRTFRKCHRGINKARAISRNLYAHHVWLSSPEAPPNSILLLDPGHFAFTRAQTEEALSVLRSYGPDVWSIEDAPSVVDVDVPPPGHVDRHAVKILFEGDLRNDLHIATCAYLLARHLREAMSRDHPKRDLAQLGLSDELELLRHYVQETRERRL